MDAIRIGVNIMIDGYVFSLTPSIRNAIRKSFPGAFPANEVFVYYDTVSDFQLYIDRLEKCVYHTLIGVQKNQLQTLKEIEYFDTITGKTLHTLLL